MRSLNARSGGFPLKLDLTAVFAADGRGVDIDCDFPFELDIGKPTTVKVAGRISNRAGIVSMELGATFPVDTVCARCCAPVHRELSVDITRTLITAYSNEDDVDDEEYLVVPDMMLDPEEVISEEIVLSLPSRFLCRDDCKGLCPICGADLNETTCSCTPPPDPRLAPLQDIKLRLSQQEEE